MHFIEVQRQPNGQFKTALTTIAGVKAHGSLRDIVRHAANCVGPNGSFIANVSFARRKPKTFICHTQRATFH